ncbi:glutathione S-transferase theta-1-like isoform X1 [Penaeus chinensis]|uniref:glutathione S-transferase theta-1-like isoform X1 n=1 Tax=Penaeus chinensis TaxID=139456 RepID=UPI001FB8414A|nr:glutathione S-transferase theta-1-like isoform X1 [Penaeus chinensis]
MRFRTKTVYLMSLKVSTRPRNMQPSTLSSLSLQLTIMDSSSQESVAILRYLCREHKADHWYPSDSKAQARVDEYLEWQHVNTRMQCAMFFQHKFLRPKMLGMPVNEKKVAEFQERMEIVLDQLETIWLKDHPFIAGDHVTIADLVAACELEQPSMAGYDVCKGRPNLTAWFKRVRDSFQPHYDEAHMMVYRVKDKFGGNPAKSNL